MADHREDEEIHDQVADERPALAVDAEVRLVVLAFTEREFVDQRGLHALGQREIEDEQDEERAIRERLEQGEVPHHDRVDGRCHDPEYRHTYDEGPSDLVAVDEQPEGNALENDHNPRDNRMRAVDHRVARS